MVGYFGMIAWIIYQTRKWLGAANTLSRIAKRLFEFTSPGQSMQPDANKSHTSEQLCTPSPPNDAHQTGELDWNNGDQVPRPYPQMTSHIQFGNIFELPQSNYPPCEEGSMAQLADKEDDFSPASICGAGYATFNDFKALYPCASNRDSPFSGHHLPAAPEYSSVPMADDQHSGFTALERFAMSSSRFQHPGANCHQTRIRTNLRKRERNMNINKAFEDLRGKIPNLPADTKVSKIKVLRLAADYIRHLNQILEDAHSENTEESSVEISGNFTPSTSPQDDAKESKKRARGEFKVDPEIVTIKRRKIDWSRIQEEITRHNNTTKSRRLTKQQTSSEGLPNHFSYPCSSSVLSCEPAFECQGFGYHQAIAQNLEMYPPGGASHLKLDTSSSPASFSSWDTE